jgi:hypothetical protein
MRRSIHPHDPQPAQRRGIVAIPARSRRDRRCTGARITHGGRWRIPRAARSVRGHAVPALPTHFHQHSPLPPLRTVLPGALLGAAAGAAVGAAPGGVLAIALLALAGALLVVALIAALPDRRPPAPHPAPPQSTPTTTLAVPAPGPDAPPGWYPDPDPPPGEPGGPGVRRLWDGERWTEHRWAGRSS